MESGQTPGRGYALHPIFRLLQADVSSTRPILGRGRLGMALEILFSLLVPVVIIGGIIALIVALVRHRGAPRESRAVMVRRIFTYGLSLLSLAAGGIGVTLVVHTILANLFKPSVVSTGNELLSLGLALTIVGVPIWLLFWAAIQRTARREPLEIQSLGRRVYFALVMAASAIASTIGAIQVARWALGGGPFSSANTAVFVVWAGVWAFHRLMERREGPFEDDLAGIQRLYTYGMSLFGVAVLAAGIGGLLHVTLAAAYNALFAAEAPLVQESNLFNGILQPSLGTAIAGGVVWWGHWKGMSRTDSSTSRQVYLYLFTILAGAVMVVSALSVGLYHVLQWFLGTPATTSSRLHFDVFPGIIAASTVGAAAWVYHWTVVREEATKTEGLGPAQRVYGYLVAAVGLGVLGTGLTILLATVLGMLAPPSTLLEFVWRNPILLAVTLLAVGVPVWGGYWRAVQRAAVTGGPAERGALSRRVFIYLIFGLAIILTLVNLSIVLFELFDALLGKGSGNIIWNVRWSLAMLVAAGAASGYYWAVLSEDRRALAQAQPPATEAVEPKMAAQKQVIVLLGVNDMSLVQRLQAALGYDVQVWQRVPPVPAAPALDEAALAALAQTIGAAASGRVLVEVDAAGVKVTPYVMSDEAEW